MSDQTNSKGTRSATSLRESEAGAMPCDSQDGRTKDPFGQGAVPANLSARQAKERGLLTSGTCGPPSTGSSASAALTQFLASRYQARTAGLGSTLYRQTWKEKTTPSGRLLPWLVASARRCSASELTGWHTPLANDAQNGGVPRALRYKGNAPSEVGNTRDPERWGNYRGDLKDWAAALLTGWPTTSARDWKDTPGMATVATNPDGSVRNRVDQLPRAAQLLGWPTPLAADASKVGNVSYRPGAAALKETVALLRNLDIPARLTVTGELLTGSEAGMSDGGRFNPAHSCWLMGYPPDWLKCYSEDTETP